MKIEKLPSGSYRIRKMYQEKTYTIVTDYKPTQKEVIQLMADKLDKVQGKHEHMTFRQAAEDYVDMKRNVLSPRTIKEYSEMPSRLPDWWNELPVPDITQIEINRLVNELSKDKSPKTVCNYHGFVSAVLGTFCPSLKLCTTLPQKVKNESYIPSRKDVKRILEEIKGSPFEIPITLACYGMRRSEICALQLEDIDGDIVRISKNMVQNTQKEWVIKTTKATESTREIIIPVELAEKIRAQGYYTQNGGWETDHVMKSVYRHSMPEKEEQAKRAATEKFQSTLFLRLFHDKIHDKKILNLYFNILKQGFINSK